MADTHDNAEPSTSAPIPANGAPERRKLTRTLLNFWVDAALLLAVVVLVWVSVVLQFAFPPPTSADGWILWSLTYNQWRDVQFGALCVCVLLALEHLVLHWNWVCSVLAMQVLRLRQRPDEGVQAVYGVGAFIAILVTMLASIIVASLSAQRPALWP